MQTLLEHPRRMDHRRPFLRDDELWITIGAGAFERRGQQRAATEKPEVYPDRDSVGCEAFGNKEDAT